MPEFGNPFAGLSIDKKLSKDELIRAIKFTIAAEMEASQMYDQIVDATTDKNAQIIIKDISNEERVHVGELTRLLLKIEPKEAEFLQKGIDEVEETLEKTKIAKLAKEILKPGN